MVNKGKINRYHVRVQARRLNEIPRQGMGGGMGSNEDANKSSIRPFFLQFAALQRVLIEYREAKFAIQVGLLLF